MSTLEVRYRRLLRAYPADHRATYEREMLGVLIEGSRPGQRFPRPADALDLLRAGLRTRVGGLLRSERDTGWRNAAAVVGLLTAVFLAAVAVRRLALGGFVMVVGEDRMQAYGVDGLIMLDVAVRVLAWLAVVAVALAGRRRAAFALAGVAGLIEVAAAVGWPPAGAGQLDVVPWRLLPVTLAVAFLGLAVKARTAGELLGARRLRLLLAATVLGVLIGLPNWLVSAWLSAGAWTLPSLGMLAAGGLLLLGLRGVEPPLRRRILVLLLSPALLLLFESGSEQTGPPTGRLLLAVGAAAIVLGAAVLLLRRRERQVRGPGAAR